MHCITADRSMLRPPLFHEMINKDMWASLNKAVGTTPAATTGDVCRAQPCPHLDAFYIPRTHAAAALLDIDNVFCAPFPDDGRAESFHDLHHCLRDLRPDAIARYERHGVGPAVAGQRHVGHETPRPRADQIPKLLQRAAQACM